MKRLPGIHCVPQIQPIVVFAITFPVLTDTDNISYKCSLVNLQHNVMQIICHTYYLCNYCTLQKTDHKITHFHHYCNAKSNNMPLTVANMY